MCGDVRDEFIYKTLNVSKRQKIIIIRFRPHAAHQSLPQKSVLCLLVIYAASPLLIWERMQPARRLFKAWLHNFPLSQFASPCMCWARVHSQKGRFCAADCDAAQRAQLRSNLRSHLMCAFIARTAMISSILSSMPVAFHWPIKLKGM